MSTGDRSGPRLPSRREFLTFGAGAFVVAALPLARSARRRLVRRSVPVMGTVAELAVVHRDARYAHGALDAAAAELARVEALMTRFRASSDVGRVNIAAPGAATAVDPETALVLAAALEWAAATHGAFDPCIGGATVLWDVAHRHAPPAVGEARRFAARGLFRSLELDTGRGVVVRRDGDAIVDLGGIAKGYGVDRAVEALRAWGIADGLVNVGGDLYALGSPDDDDAWEVGVRSPDDPARLATVLRVTERAVATSGDYLQYFDHGGRRYHHLLDPATGEPRRTATRSLTIASDDCMSADAAATALFGSARAGTLPRRIEILHHA